jgi:hypothetical protein
MDLVKLQVFLFPCPGWLEANMVFGNKGTYTSQRVGAAIITICMAAAKSLGFTILWMQVCIKRYN